MNLEPLFDRVVIERAEASEVTKGGIHIPDAAKEKPTRGKVLAVGPGRVADNGETIKPVVAKGDEVLYERYGGTEIEIDDEKFVVVRESEILAICKRKGV